MSYTKDQMIAIGGKEWKKSDGTVRIYLNNADELIGLSVERYKSGNICYAELNGKTISNSKASMIMSAKTYWEDGEVYTTIDQRYVDALVEGIDREISKRQANLGETQTA